jgi:hypothetical protein
MPFPALNVCVVEVHISHYCQCDTIIMMDNVVV